jgi:hypothetical protein
MGGTTTQQTVQSSAPSNPDVNPTVSTLLKGVQGAYAAGGSTPQYSQYAGVGNNTTQGWNNALTAANNPTFTAGAQDSLENTAATARGDFLNGSNPYFEGALSKSLGDVSTGVNAALGANGRYGGSPHVQALSQELGNVSTNARLGQYNQERQYQTQAQDRLGSIYQQTLAPSAAQMQVGSLQDANSQAALQGQYDLDQRRANTQTDLLAKLSAILAGTAPYGGTTTTGTTTSPGANPLQVGLGALLGGAGLFL